MIQSIEGKDHIDGGERRPARTLWRGLVFQLFTIVILPLSVLLLITTVAGYAIHQQSMRDLAAERNKLTVQAIATALGEMLQHQQTMVSVLAERAQAASTPADLETALTASASIMDDPDASLAIFDADGKFLTTTGNRDIWELPNTAEIIQEARSAHSAAPASLVLQKGAEQTAFLVMATATNDGEKIAALAFSPATLIQRSVGDLTEEGDLSVYVITQELQVLFYTGSGDLHTPLVEHLGVNQAHFGETGAAFLSLDSNEHIAAYSPVEPFGWALVIEEPWASIASRRLRITENVPLVLAPIMVLALLALWFSYRMIVRPLQTLGERAAELGWGNFQAIEEPVGGIEEIRTLQEELIHLAGKVQAAQKGLRNYIGAITIGQEEERRRLARELHDDTLQSLIALNQRLQMVYLIGDGASGERQAEMIDQLQDLAAQTIQDLRRITQALRPVYLEELGLASALEMLVREIDRSESLGIVFQRTGIEVRLRPEIELALYRIVQEALTNVVKHAHASQASVRIVYGTESIELAIRDNGVGFIQESPASLAQMGHFGLVGLHERAEMIGAQMDIQSEAGEGSQILVRVPKSEESNFEETV